MARSYHVYILASDSRELYVGISNDLYKRIAQHRGALDPSSYTVRHKIRRLVYCESTQDVLTAIRREKQIKGWSRLWPPRCARGDKLRSGLHPPTLPPRVARGDTPPFRLPLHPSS